MEDLQLREQEIFNFLDDIKEFDIVVIGGYAVNVYTLPRFSVDCDIVVHDKTESEKIGKKLVGLGYSKKDNDHESYTGNFARYEKTIKNNFKVSFDILIGEVFDRDTKAKFSADWIFSNSSFKPMRGKTVLKQIKMRVINIDALIAMKIASCRSTDIRDVFMLFPYTSKKSWIKEQIQERCNFNERFSIVKVNVGSEKFRNDLQGAYGYVNDKVFQKHKDAILTFS
jgi:hypothetical protein